MKPANIMLKPDGSVMLIDFGIAREFKEYNVEDTSCLGTRGYAAPEQFGGKGQTDARTDIYCLGATIYHLITGHNPCDPPYEMYPIRHWNPAFSSGLEKIILKCTQQNPEDRYQSCAELLYALEHYEEEDEGYKRKQNIRWYTFLSTAVMMILMMIATILSYVGMQSKASSTYEEYLNTASLTLDINEKYQFYEKAIELSPIRGEAYEAMLESMQMDGIFSEMESQEIRKIMPVYMNDLKNNRDSFVKIAYELGIMYFYYYEDVADIQNASKWLSMAIGSTVNDMNENEVDLILGEKKSYRARHLYQMMQYYRNLDSVNKEGDYGGNYIVLWEDLSAIITPNLAQEDNNVTALILYNFMANQLVLHMNEFKNAGITEEDIKQKIEMMQESAKQDGNNQYEEDLYKRLLGNLSHAEKRLSISFNGEGE